MYGRRWTESSLVGYRRWWSSDAPLERLVARPGVQVLLRLRGLPIEHLIVAALCDIDAQRDPDDVAPTEDGAGKGHLEDLIIAELSAKLVQELYGDAEGTVRELAGVFDCEILTSGVEEPWIQSSDRFLEWCNAVAHGDRSYGHSVSAAPLHAGADAHHVLQVGLDRAAREELTKHWDDRSEQFRSARHKTEQGRVSPESGGGLLQDGVRLDVWTCSRTDGFNPRHAYLPSAIASCAVGGGANRLRERRRPTADEDLPQLGRVTDYLGKLSEAVVNGFGEPIGSPPTVQNLGSYELEHQR
jgi:hypothetical protein